MFAARIFFALSFGVALWAQNTVRLTGRVTDVATGQPVEDAIVKLGSDAAGGFGETAYTDASGYYSFEKAPTGAAQVDIRAQGFVSFRSTNPDDVSIRIGADQANHDFRLTRSARIIGKILNKESDQAGGALTAVLLREDFTEGIRHFVLGGDSGTESIGASCIVEKDGSFSFTALRPGRYMVSVSRRPSDPVGVILSGVAFPARPTVPAQASDAFVQTYFPGTTEFGDALAVTLVPGETRTMDFKVAKKPVFRASGEMDLPSDTGEVTVPAIAMGDGASRNFYQPVIFGRSTGPGKFVIEGLPPGRYTIPTLRVAELLSPPIRVDRSFTITDHDVEGLRLIPLPPEPQLSVNGLFRMANEATTLPAGLAVQFAYPQPGGQSDLIAAAPNGTFWLTGAPGEYSVRPAVPAGYAVTGIRYGGGNYLNSVIPMRGDTLDSSLTIVLSDQPGSVNGLLIDGDQKPAAAHVVLAPEILPAGFDFRALRVVSTDSQGAFVFTGLPRGRYKAVALTGDDRKRDHDLAILRDKLALADGFDVTAGQGMTIRLRP